jgi:DNA-binding PadR family transcriptional regulator
MENIVTTHYAVLGLLAARPWSAYELTQHMRRSNLRELWPRAESKLYEAPKRLVAEGLATTRREKVGTRHRTVYRITAKGRRALREWLDTPGRHLVSEFEAGLKVAFATEGSIEQLRAQLRHLRENPVPSHEEAKAALDQALDVGFVVPERVHTSALIVELARRVRRAVGEWAEWAEDEIAEWEDTKIDEAKAERGRAVYSQMRDLVEELASESGGE